MKLVRQGRRPINRPQQPNRDTPLIISANYLTAPHNRLETVFRRRRILQRMIMNRIRVWAENKNMLKRKHRKRNRTETSKSAVRSVSTDSSPYSYFEGLRFFISSFLIVHV